MKINPKFYNNLNLCLDKIINLMASAVKDRKSPFHTPLLSTVDNRNKPNSRTVVLRQFFHKKWVILIHSDIRSKKITEIKKNKNICIVFYDEQEKIQLRLSGQARIEKNYNNAWEKLSTWSRRCYLSDLKPGSSSNIYHSGFNKKYSKNAPSFEDSEKGKENFCCILCKIDRIEWLYLSSIGHRRAEFKIKREQNDKIKISKQWIIP